MIGAGVGRATLRFHGLELHVTADNREILLAMKRRFAASPFSSTAAPTGALHFTVRSVPIHSVPKAAEGGRVVYESPSGRAYWYEDERLELASDTGHAVCRPAGDTAELTVALDAPDGVWTASRPLFALMLAELLKQRGLYFLHAGAVQTQGGALLLPGNSGSGKSTLTAALAASGLPLLGDDSVFLEPIAHELRVRSFPDELDLSIRSLELLGLEDRPRSRLNGTEKWQLAVADAGLAVGDEVSQPSLLVFPVLGGDEASLEELTEGEALLELAPNVLLTSRAAVERHLATLGQLVASVPSYRLALGPRLNEAVQLLRALASG